MTKETLTVPIFSSKDKEVISGLPDVVNLYSEYLEYRWKTKIRETEEGVLKEREFMGQQNVLRKGIISVMANWRCDEEIFVCNIRTQNDSSDFSLAFKTMAEAISFKDRLWVWVLQL